MDQYIGKMLDNRYEILECIGTGGMAMVYKARCHRLNRLVAVKILKPELAQDAEFRRRFHDESQAVAMLSHSNIVAVYDVSSSNGLDYIVMELVDGMTLKQYMKKRGAPLNWREAVHFITQIVRALDHAHSRGIVHRDIKPQNILVLRDGSAKVTDFGIARVASAAQSTLTQEALGSVHYISPEQARGSHIDGRSDLYSAGVVLYEMLTGRLPFEGETPVSVAIQHINSIPIPPRDLNDAIPEALEAIVLKAMAPRPEDRYASAEEMLADLEEFRKNPDAMPMYAKPGQEEALLNEPTRVVPVSEIKSEERRNRAADRDRDKDPGKERRSGRGNTGRASGGSRYVDDDPYEEPRRGSVLPYVFAVLAILLFVGGMVYFVFNLFFGEQEPAGPVMVKVPDVTIYTWDQLENDPTLYEGFTVRAEYEENEAEAGTVLRQDPVEGTEIEETASKMIVVTVSSGMEEPPLVVPPLAGEEWSKARDLLWGMKLNPTSREENSSDVKKDCVIRTIPGDGSSVQPGDTVIVVVSLGEEEKPVNVPDFSGWDKEEAERVAKELGLVPEFQEKESEKDPDTVIWQSITANTGATKGDKIVFWISLGPQEVPTPTVEPTDSPEPSPSESPDMQPSHTTAVAVTKPIPVDLTPYSHLESVQVRIIVGESEVVREELFTSLGSYTYNISQIGPQRVEIYIDDQLYKSYVEDFS